MIRQPRAIGAQWASGPNGRFLGRARKWLLGRLTEPHHLLGRQAAGPTEQRVGRTRAEERGEQAEPCCWAGYMNSVVFELKFFFSEALFLVWFSSLFNFEPKG